MKKSCKAAAGYIAALKAISLISQYCHWTTKGDNFYGNHLMFERIYKSTLEDLDAAAEKLFATLGEDCLDYTLQATILNSILLSFKKLSDSKVAILLTIEKQFLKLSQATYKAIENEGEMTQGIDDLLLSIANNHENSIYLLQQVLKK